MALNGKQILHTPQAPVRLSRTVVYGQLLEQILFPGKAAKIVGVSFDPSQGAIIFDIAGTDVPDSEWFNVQVTEKDDGTRNVKFVPVQHP